MLSDPERLGKQYEAELSPPVPIMSPLSVSVILVISVWTSVMISAERWWRLAMRPEGEAGRQVDPE